MKYFVQQGSIVRQIWGKSDTILFIFAGASAEFALNKAVDWLFFTGRLPADPLGRLFSTVGYARKIVFSEEAAAHQAIDSMAAIHAGVEAKRGLRIPDWAYRDVLFMLIDYSIRSFELLERKLTEQEQAEVFEVFNRVGVRMGIKGLPESFTEWQLAREEHLQQNLQKSSLTSELYLQYRKHLGNVRYWLLLQAQVLVVPECVRAQLNLWRVPLLKPVLIAYKLSRALRAEWLLKELILPPAYKAEIKELDALPAS
ncbi:oxygenase MpaB family protein [uncultured Pontibacter sp.]|uniref:oxygenase MpaB family protein n=1 Tax=uncultured Pontibacter sp. TaxID=453356 RepID=UPI00261E1457|nr:oxygenase MpaB family protein [uncultured Pontibacter sp.]